MAKSKTEKLSRKELGQKIDELETKIEKLESGEEFKKTLGIQLDNKMTPELPAGTPTQSIHNAGEKAANFAVDESVKELVTRRDELYEQHDTYVSQKRRKNIATGALVAALVVGGVDIYSRVTSGSTMILGRTGRIVRGLADFTSSIVSSLIGDRSQRVYNPNDMFHIDAQVEGDSNWYNFHALNPEQKSAVRTVRFAIPRTSTPQDGDPHFPLQPGGSMSIGDIANGVVELVSMAQFSDGQASRIDPVKGYGATIMPYILTTIASFDDAPGISQADLLEAQNRFRKDGDLRNVGIEYTSK